MKRNIAIVGVLAAVSLAWLVAGRRLAGPSLRAAAAASGTQPGQMAPSFSLKTLDRRAVRLSHLRGRVVLLNFWATWCAPCRVETPWLVEFDGQYRAQGLEIVGIAMDDGNADAVAAFTREFHVGYAIALGNNDVGDAYGGVQFLPQSFFLDRQGRIVRHLLGAESREQIEEAIRQALAADAPAGPR